MFRHKNEWRVTGSLNPHRSVTNIFVGHGVTAAPDEKVPAG